MIEAEKKVVQDAIEEMINSFTRMDAERDLIKQIVAKVKEETTVTPRVFRKMAKVAYKANFAEEVATHEEFEELYQEIISG
jgi:uncharacterized protein YukE